MYKKYTWDIPMNESIECSMSLIWSYDCTFKESLYSTYPYLTYSNERIATPMMRGQSTHGFREDNSTSMHNCPVCCGEEQHQELFQSWCLCVHFE